MPPCWNVGMEIRNKRKFCVCFLLSLFKILCQCSRVLLQGFWCKNNLGGGTQLFCTLKLPFLYMGAGTKSFTSCKYSLKIFFLCLLHGTCRTRIQFQKLKLIAFSISQYLILLLSNERLSVF